MNCPSCGPATFMRHLACAIAPSQHKSAESANALFVVRRHSMPGYRVSEHRSYQTRPAMRRRRSRQADYAALHTQTRNQAQSSPAVDLGEGGRNERGITQCCNCWLIVTSHEKSEKKRSKA